jgi:signal transduction histidine kinase/DNA-binding response OmpR family regulator
LKIGNPLVGAPEINRKSQAHNQILGNVCIWLNPKSDKLYVQKLLDYILPSISMEILNSLSFKLLTDYRNELEEKVSDRTKQLHKINRALTESLNKLQDLKNSRDGFFAAISHEFRTPLTLIMGPIEKIIENSTEAETKKKAEIIWRNANRMLSLVNQLLDLSRLDYGKLELKTTSGNIVDFIRSLLFSFESFAESKEIMLKLFSEDDNIELYFDPEVMMKIITNLLSNAFKFTDVGGVISIKIVKVENTSVQIKIKDTGIGISESDISKLFDRFYQVDQSLTRKYEGSGIGLALTKELVELHHGKIFVESKSRILGDENSGWTEFKLEFPLGTSHFKVDEITNAEAQQKNISDSNYLIKEIFLSSKVNNAEISEDDKTVVLIVEDNTDLREMIKDNLLDTYSVLEAENGASGLKLAEENIPDLIISDIMMPEMDGYELTKKIKINEKTNHIPVILLTAKAATEDKLVGLETGADDYLIKPFNEKELTVRVRNLIKIREQMREKYLAQSLVKPGSVVVPSSQKVFLDKLTSIVHKNISNETFSVEVLCREIGMSRTQLHRKIKSVTNQSTTEFIRNYRLQLAAELLKQDGGNIAEISNQVGFGSQAYFTKLFQELYSLTPLEYKKQHSK